MREIVAGNGTPDLSDSDRFRLAVAFDEQAHGKTILTLRHLHPGSQRHKEVIRFAAGEYGLKTLDDLAKWLDA